MLSHDYIADMAPDMEDLHLRIAINLRFLGLDWYRMDRRLYGRTILAQDGVIVSLSHRGWSFLKQKILMENRLILQWYIKFAVKLLIYLSAAFCFELLHVYTYGSKEYLVAARSEFRCVN